MPRRREGPAEIFAGGIRGRKTAKDLESNGLGAKSGEEASAFQGNPEGDSPLSLWLFREPSGNPRSGSAQTAHSWEGASRQESGHPHLWVLPGRRLQPCSERAEKFHVRSWLTFILTTRTSGGRALLRIRIKKREKKKMEKTNKPKTHQSGLEQGK